LFTLRLDFDEDDGALNGKRGMELLKEDVTTLTLGLRPKQRHGKM